MTLILAPMLNVGNPGPDAKGDAGVEDPQAQEYRCRVSGAEPLVVVMNARNGAGAKGWPHSAESVVPTGDGMSR